VILIDLVGQIQLGRIARVFRPAIEIDAGRAVKRSEGREAGRRAFVRTDSGIEAVEAVESIVVFVKAYAGVAGQMLIETRCSRRTAPGAYTLVAPMQQATPSTSRGNYS
jgi:hypothetical protein